MGNSLRGAHHAQFITSLTHTKCVLLLANHRGSELRREVAWVIIDEAH